MGLHLHHPIHTNLPINNLYLDKEPIYTVPASKRAINHPDFSISQFLGIFNKPTRAGKSHHFCWWFSYVFFTCRVPAKKIYRQVIYYYFSTNLLCYLTRADYVVCIYINTHLYDLYVYRCIFAIMKLTWIGFLILYSLVIKNHVFYFNQINHCSPQPRFPHLFAA